MMESIHDAIKIKKIVTKKSTTNKNFIALIGETKNGNQVSYTNWLFEPEVYIMNPGLFKEQLNDIADLFESVFQKLSKSNTIKNKLQKIINKESYSEKELELIRQLINLDVNLEG